MLRKRFGGIARRAAGSGAAVAVTVATLTACSDSTPVSNPEAAGRGTGAGSGGEGGEATGGSGGRALTGEYVHRDEATTCPFPERIDESGIGGEGGTATGVPCDSDDDCADESNGYCIRSTALPFSSVGCRYACETDADCAESEVCACGSSQHASTGTLITLGICARSTCTTDADCADGALCISPLSNSCRQTRPFSFHCQTPTDECRGGRDCGPAGICARGPDHFTCAVC